MKFWQFLRFTEPSQLPPLARVAEEAGFHGVMIADHVAFPEQIESEYPYDPSGKPFWDPTVPWPDPWCAIASMAAVTERIHFSTNVSVAPLRHPVELARSLATLSNLSANRVALGSGAGWMKEEFDIMGIDFASRGRRYDEMIDLMRTLWKGEMADFRGEIFQLPKMQMSPTPTGTIPIYLAGGSKPAMRRAARKADGWIAGNFTLKSLPGMIATVSALRQEAGRASEPFRFIAPAREAPVDVYRRLEEMGVTDIINLPEIDEIGPAASQSQKADYVERFADKYLHHFE